MHQVKPAMVLRGRKRAPHVVLFVLTALMALWAVGSVIALAVESSSGAEGTFEYLGMSLPLRALFAVSAVVAGYATWDTYAGWRMTGPNHGVIDYVLEPAGIRLTRPRKVGRASELLVQRGESVEISAELVFQRRAGTERHYRFTVSAPGGSFTFTQPIYVEKLSLVPLDEVARDRGIELRTSDAATAVERLGVNAQ